MTSGRQVFVLLMFHVPSSEFSTLVILPFGEKNLPGKNIYYNGFLGEVQINFFV